MSHTFMRSESAKAFLSDNVVPVHYNVYPNCLVGSVNLRALALKVEVLAIHERGEIMACESVEIVS